MYCMHLQSEALQHAQTADDRDVERRQTEGELVHDVPELPDHVGEIEVSDGRI